MASWWKTCIPSLQQDWPLYAEETQFIALTNNAEIHSQTVGLQALKVVSCNMCVRTKTSLQDLATQIMQCWLSACIALLLSNQLDLPREHQQSSASHAQHRHLIFLVAISNSSDVGTQRLVSEEQWIGRHIPQRLDIGSLRKQTLFLCT